MGDLTKCTYPFIRNFPDNARVAVDVAAFVLAEVAEQQHGYILEGSADVARIRNVVVGVFEDGLPWLDLHHFPGVLGHPIIFLAAVWALRGRLRPELDALVAEEMLARQFRGLARGNVQAYRAHRFAEDHDPTLLQLRNGSSASRHSANCTFRGNRLIWLLAISAVGRLCLRQ